MYNKGDLLKQGWHWEPSGGGIYSESSRALAKLWSALMLYLPFLFLPTTDWPMNTAAHRGWPWYPGNKPDSNSQLCAGKRGPLSHYSLIIPFTMKNLHMDNDYFPNCGCSIWKIRGRQLSTGSTFVGLWCQSEKICTMNIQTQKSSHWCDGKMTCLKFETAVDKTISAWGSFNSSSFHHSMWSFSGDGLSQKLNFISSEPWFIRW